MPILKQKIDTATKVFGLRIPAALHSEYEQIREEADHAGLVFSVNGLLIEALVRILRQAQAELREVRALRVPESGGEA